jgi:hypothetical protein
MSASIAFYPAFVAIATRPSLGWNDADNDFDLGSASSEFLKFGIICKADMHYRTELPH